MLRNTLLPESHECLIEPCRCGYHFPTAGHHIGLSADAALCCREPYEIFGGFYPLFRVGIFSPDMLCGLLAIMVFSVSGERAPGGFDVAEQEIDFRLQGGMGENGTKDDTENQGTKDTGCPQMVN